MFIKKLELFGFKSFAERTEIDLSDGITAVVGPNGCGKSNIADAVQWVLGESNIRNLRGRHATDVIFNGSEKRRAVGLGEVSLTLDNSCGTLPINFSEVTVTRRSYRSGEGEYFINKTRCRLKDIYELFLDTGIGREAYSMVTQGEIDAVLSAKPEDRRELLEEAAGVKKYRYRRKEALRKLDRTEANLQRVRDIMSEIGGQLEPLSEQAEAAARYEELQSRLREIEIGLLIRDLRKNTRTLEEVRDSKKGADERIAGYDKQLSDLEWQKDKQTTRLSELEEDIEGARRVQMNLSGNVQRLEGKAALLDERLRSTQSERSRTEEDIAALEHKIEESRKRAEALALEEKECSEAESAAEAGAEAGSRSLAELDRRFEEASRNVNDHKASYLDIAKELAAARNALQNSTQRSAQLEAALEKHDREIAELSAAKAEAEKRGTEAAAEVESLRTRIGQLTAQIDGLNNDRERAENRCADLNRRHAEVAHETAAKSSRLGTLREMAEAHEGFFEGVRSVMAGHKAGKLSGKFAVVADVITVPKGYETAIETALGASVQDIVTDSVEEAKRAIEHLKANSAGRATFLPLDGMKPSSDKIRGRVDRPGAIGIAADLIDYESKYAPAIRSLLGGTVIADDIDKAVALSKQLKGWRAIVTLEGELIAARGAITGGARKTKRPGLLARKQEIDELTAEVARLERQASELQEKIESGEKNLADLQSRAAEAQKSLADGRTALAEQENQAGLAANQAASLTRQIEVSSLEKDEIQVLLNEETENVARLRRQVDTVGKENTDLDQVVAGGEQSIEELAEQRSAERERIMRLNVDLASCSERAASLRSALEQANAACRESTEAVDSRRQRLEAISTELTALSEERDAASGECERQRELLAAADARLNEVVESRTRELEKATAIDARLKEAARERNELAHDTHAADVREARLEVQVAQATDRLLEEYEITPEQTLDWPEDIEVERGTATEVARLRGEIRRMGPVNTGAVQEYQRIKERWDFLTEQRDDLEAARDQINSAIREIDTNTREVFMGTFDRVAANFEIVFKRLFGGGKTQLSLTDPNDLVETGIDVIVQPPGKKLQDMALLSGGERALTATALIFALLMTKPSPFVVLDEVDAPLDETNVERFAEVLKEFAANSQFVVVTHNRATMEAADSLYGVTMQEPGISKLISVKLAAEGPIESEVTNGALATV